MDNIKQKLNILSVSLDQLDTLFKIEDEDFSEIPPNGLILYFLQWQLTNIDLADSDLNQTGYSTYPAILNVLF